MSHFGGSGHSDRTDSYSLLVLNVSFRATAEDLYPLFDKYGKVIDIFIPRDRSYTGLVNLVGLHLFATNTKMKHKRLWIGYMGESWMEEKSLFNLQSMGPMLNELLKEGLSKRYQEAKVDQAAGALREGQVSRSLL